ncbi:MAG: hypothetical protein DHS20C05_10450 [Hyphococcus sp.]|nr:MAG: hypothetical protein DHS20C05_10450 [Marinicaulis sp.]
MLSDVAALFDGVAVAPAADRRLTRRLVDAWARAARGHFPSWDALQEMDMGDDWRWMFAVDLEKSVGFPYFIYLGESLARLSDVYLSGQTDWTMSLLEKATSDVFAAAAAEAPHFREDTLTLCNGRQLLLRVVTAPLADDGSNITHVVGAANGRFAPEVPLAAV